RRADSPGRPPGDQGDPGRVRPAEGTHALGADRGRRRCPHQPARRSSHGRSRYRPGGRTVARRGERQPDAGRYLVHPVSRFPGRTGRRHNRATCRGTLLGAHGRPSLPAAGRSARLEHRRLQPMAVRQPRGGTAADLNGPQPSDTARPACQVVAWTACRMTLVTTPGSETMDKCGAFTSVMWACAFSAMASCSVGGMAWSAVPTTAQDGMVCQPGTPDGSVRALVAMGSWVAASTFASLAGRPLAMHDGNALWVI